jgi:hypothetical protein
MAIYFLKGDQHLPEKKPVAASEEKPWRVARASVLIAGVIAIVLATIIEATGLLRPWESRLPELVGLPSPIQDGIVFLSLPDGTGEGNDSMDVALVLRGLYMLHPSLILLATEKPASGESAQLLQGVKDQLREKGIPLTEAVPPTPESLWRPIPLCRYFAPGFAERKESLPLVAGSAPAEGSFRVLEPSSQDPGILPLLSTTASGEIAGSLWWNGLMQGQPNAPVWLLADHLLLFPNHAALPLITGGLSVPHDLAVPRSITSDDFLLRMEERERGSLSPDFDSLWDHAIVVVGPSSLLPMTSALVSLRQMTALGALNLVTQAGIMILLIVIILAVTTMSWRESFLLTGILLMSGCLGFWWCLRQGILPPILPWGVAMTFSLVGILTKRHKSIR